MTKVAESTTADRAAKTHTPFFKKANDTDLPSTETENSFFPRQYATALLQTKLNIGQPNDAYEKEADAVADKVVQRSVAADSTLKNESTLQTKPLAATLTPLIQEKCENCEKEDALKKEKLTGTASQTQRKPIFESNTEQKNLQLKCAACEKEEKELQRKSNSLDTTTSPAIERKLNTSKGSSSPLPAETKSEMERSIGSDFSDVRVHTDSSAVQMSTDLNAQAFTNGNDIYFNTGKYNTNSTSGKHLLAHELTHTIQQTVSSKGVQKKDDATEEHLTSLNEMLDRYDVPEQEVISLLRQLTPEEKLKVNSDLTYKVKMAAAFSIGEMVSAMIILNPPLEQKLQWVEAATSSTDNIDYVDISFLIISSTQPERDALKTIRWRNFFVEVCTNSTIITAVTDLRFDLKTQLEWIKEEASPSNLDYADIQQLIIKASQPDRDAIKNNTWRDFFVGVCTNATIITAVTDLEYDLKTQLEWIKEEASPKNLDYAQLKPLVLKASQPDRDVLKTNVWRDFFVGVCDNDTIIDAVTDLHYDIKTKMEWLMAEDTYYSGFKTLILASTAADKAIILGDTAFLRTLKDYFSTWNNFAKTVELLGRSIPSAGTLIGDPTVRGALSSAWALSSASLTCAGGPTLAHEEGGWIYLNIITGAITTQAATAGAQASIDLWSPPDVDDSVIVATFHTHPNVGPCWGAPFASTPDISNANKRGVPNIVRGAFPAIANISDVSGGPAQRLHLAGSQLFPGKGGGTEPQTSLNKKYDSE